MKAAPRARAAASRRLRRASVNVRCATVRIALRIPGRRAAARPPASTDEGPISDDLQEQLLERGTPRGEMIEADALRRQPAGHLRQALLALHAQAQQRAVLAQVTAEPSQRREDVG